MPQAARVPCPRLQEYPAPGCKSTLPQAAARVPCPRLQEYPAPGCNSTLPQAVRVPCPRTPHLTARNAELHSTWKKCWKRDPPCAPAARQLQSPATTRECPILTNMPSERYPLPLDTLSHRHTVTPSHKGCAPLAPHCMRGTCRTQHAACCPHHAAHTSPHAT
eukprot:354463-Chlamydomonas_euryale.AAC.10